MALPAKIRVNTSVPFPALVTGTGPVTITKVNGVWQIGLNLTLLSALLAAQGGTPPMFRIAGATPISVLANDSIIGIDTNAIGAASVVNLPTGASRNGVPVTFKDVTRKAATWNVSITPSGTETIDGLTGAQKLIADGQSMMLLPVTGGWFRIG